MHRDIAANLDPSETIDKVKHFEHYKPYYNSSNITNKYNQK